MLRDQIYISTLLGVIAPSVAAMYGNILLAIWLALMANFIQSALCRMDMFVRPS